MFANLLKTVSVASLATVMSMSSALAVDLEFYFPVAVGGAAADTIEKLTAEYAAANPDVNIEAIYAGSYSDAGQKALTAARGGQPPQISVLLSTQMYALIDEDVIVPFDDFVSEEDKAAWIGGFYPSFMENSQYEGKTYGIPFQRSTPVLYWNKEAFAAAGLDPETPPANWDEMVEMGKALTMKDDNGNVSQWGVRIPSAGFPYWLFQGLTTPAGAILADGGTKVNFNDDKVVEALEYLVDLSKEHEIMQPGSIEWGPTPKAFFEGETAMMWTTTGNLTNVRTNAPFDFGVAMLPEPMTHFREAFPAVDFTIRLRIKQQILNLLYDGRVTLGLSASPLWDKGVEILARFRNPIRAAVAAGHPLAKRHHLTMQALHQYPIYRSTLSPTATALIQGLAEQARRGNGTGDIYIPAIMAAPLLMQGQGVTFVPQALVQKQVDDGQIVLLDLADMPDLYTEPLLIHLSERALDAPNKAFVAMLCERWRHMRVD